MPPVFIDTSGVAAPGSPIYQTTGTVTATIGGVTAPVLFAGLTPTFAGLYQVNIVVPSGLASGVYPIVLTAAGQTSQSGVSLIVGP